MSSPRASSDTIESRITYVGVRPVLLDTDLAELHGLPLPTLREIVLKHFDHFPGELCFQPEAAELRGVRPKERPDVFTEQGAWMAAALIGSPAARILTIEISRAFARARRQSPRNQS